MKKISSLITGFAAGLAGAAIFFLIALAFNWGGLGDSDNVIEGQAVPGAPAQLSSTPVLTSGDLTPAQIYDQYADSVVQIVSSFNGSQDLFQALPQEGIGSGFVVSREGYILTNAHVVTEVGSGETRDATGIEINFNNGKRMEAEIVGYDLTGSDVAVLKVDPEDLDLVPATLGDSDDVTVGEAVVAIGSAFGVYDSTLTAGIVSAIDRTVESPESGFVIQDAIQTDAAINRGNSGGPLFNARGEVIGLNEQIISTSGGSEGVGFAVPINTAKRVMDQIIETSTVEYAWMGIVGQSVDEDLADRMELTVDQGAIISDVQSDGPAEKAGLEVNDIITKVDDRDISSMDDIIGLLIEYSPGDRIKVTYVRSGETQEAELELGTRPDRL